jgi:hypothetical protein
MRFPPCRRVEPEFGPIRRQQFQSPDAAAKEAGCFWPDIRVNGDSLNWTMLDLWRFSRFFVIDEDFLDIDCSAR